MKISNKFLGIALSAIAAGALVGCTNELKDPNAQLPPGIRLAKSPDITAWSGNHYFNSDTRGNFLNVPGSTFVTRDSEGGQNAVEKTEQWDYDEALHENEDWEKYFPLTIPSDAKTIQEDQNAQNILVPKGFNGEFNINTNGRNIYVEGHITSIAGNWGGNVYVLPSGSIDNFNPSTSSTNIYNEGEITITKDDNIEYVYNKGILNFGLTDIKASHIKLFSEGVKITFMDGTDLKCHVDIHNMVYCNGDLKIQNSEKQYICGLDVKGHLDLTSGKLETGYIKANSISFDGAHIWLLPEAYVGANLISMPNSECNIYCAKNSYAFIKTGDIVFGNLNNFVDSFSEGIYFSVTGKVTINELVHGSGGESNTTNTYETIKDYLASEHGAEARPRFNFEESGNPICGEEWSPGEDDFVEIDPDECPRCPHKKHEGSCEECEEEGWTQYPCYPKEDLDQECPNKDNPEYAGGCIHDEEDHDLVDGNWICKKCKPGESKCNPEEEICDKCEHPQHDDTCEECEKQDKHTPCDPCPKADQENPEDHGCGHAGHLHQGNICTECVKEGQTSVCNPEEGGNGGGTTEEPTGCPNKDPQDPSKGCSHNHKGHYCDQCDEEDGNCKHPETTPGVRTSSEVEVNLSILDEHPKYVSPGISDLVAKLSIHVRVGGDVEVFIPIPADYYVANDDIVILNTHEPGEFIHGGPISVEYTIAGKPVTLTLKYETDGIKVTTDGIDDEVFEDCVANYGDGVNFEVWIYTNNESGLNFTSFHNMLDRAKIKFLDKEPDYYINAFNDTKDNPQGKKDCVVSIVDSQLTDYPDSETGTHLNGSSFNKIWKKTGHEGKIVGHDHIFLWGEPKK